MNFDKITEFSQSLKTKRYCNHLLLITLVKLRLYILFLAARVAEPGGRKAVRDPLVESNRPRICHVVYQTFVRLTAESPSDSCIISFPVSIPVLST